MSRHEVGFDQVFPAPRSKIFKFFGTHEKVGLIFGGKFERIKDGEDAKNPDGLGSVRRITLPLPGPSFEETVITFQPETLIEYIVSRGSPIKNHLGHIEFSDAPNGGTRVKYSITFEPRIPCTGLVIKGILAAGFKMGLPKVMKNLD
jgi:hypothetical protein